MQLIAFYEANAPDKLVSVDIVLAKFAGRHDALVKSLETKYGAPFAGAASTVREQLIDLFAKHNPARIQTVDILLEKAKTDATITEKALVERVENKYGLPGAPNTAMAAGSAATVSFMT